MFQRFSKIFFLNSYFKDFRRIQRKEKEKRCEIGQNILLNKVRNLTPKKVRDWATKVQDWKTIFEQIKGAILDKKVGNWITDKKPNVFNLN